MRALRYMGVRTTHFPTVTLAGLTCNLSMVDGTAFITNPSVDLTPYVGCKITLTDTSGYKAVGWIKAKGSAETLDTEIVLDTGFDNPSNWNGPGSVSGSKGHTTATEQYLRQNSVKATGELRKAVLGSAVMTGGAKYRIVFTGNIVSVTSTAASLTSYGTISGTDLDYPGVQQSGSGTVDYDDFSVKKVLTPSATGVTITSSLDGATFNWFAKHSGFLPNAASFTAIIEG